MRDEHRDAAHEGEHTAAPLKYFASERRGMKSSAGGAVCEVSRLAPRPSLASQRDQATIEPASSSATS